MLKIVACVCEIFFALQAKLHDGSQLRRPLVGMLLEETSIKGATSSLFYARESSDRWLCLRTLCFSLLGRFKDEHSSLYVMRDAGVCDVFAVPY